MSGAFRTSIVIPVWNQLGYTVICLDYLLENTDSPFELVVVDNGSDSETRRYIESRVTGDTSASLVYLRNDVNIGPIKALNQGLDKCSGDIVLMMHNDLVIFEAGWLAKLEALFDSEKGMGLVGLAGRGSIDKKGLVDESSLVHSLINEDLNGPMEVPYAEAAVLDGVFIGGRKDFLRQIGGFDEVFGMMHYYDLDISMRSLRAGMKNMVLNVRAMHINNGGMTRKTRQYKKMVPDDLKLLNKNFKLFFDKWKKLLPVKKP